ncbi:ABC-three component system middle component 5 [Roseomonas gilardii]|uniref:ABC-three component system middle component 5 n=1 Tax=Roseomonas gilardii TaxID=257708 RepID=UPI0011A8E2D5|nr:ABC-three component system middle component 5 [Roseomonas gilardii]
MAPVIQLSYQPAFDAAHAIFRFLRIKIFLGLINIEFEKLRILDFYLLFPFQAAGIRLRTEDVWVRAIAKKLEGHRSYAKLPSPEILFEKMKVSQVAGLQTMAAAGSVDIEAMRNSLVKFKHFDLPADLVAKINQANEREVETMEIVKALQHYPLLGKDGLKDRTGLLEYRYDHV